MEIISSSNFCTDQYNGVDAWLYIFLDDRCNPLTGENAKTFDISTEEKHRRLATPKTSQTSELPLSLRRSSILAEVMCLTVAPIGALRNRGPLLNLLYHFMNIPKI